MICRMYVGLTKKTTETFKRNATMALAIRTEYPTFCTSSNVIFGTSSTSAITPFRMAQAGAK